MRSIRRNSDSNDSNYRYIMMSQTLEINGEKPQGVNGLCGLN